MSYMGSFWRRYASSYARSASVLRELMRRQRLSGASLLIFANKTDVRGCMTGQEILEVSFSVDVCDESTRFGLALTRFMAGIEAERDPNAQVEHSALQRDNGRESQRGLGLGCRRC
jgi:hypothetical protein